MILETWGNVLGQSFQDIWLGVANFIPNLIVAIVIFVVGWLIAALLGKVVSQIIRSIKLDTALRSAGFETVVNRAGFTLDSGVFIGDLVKWFIVVVFLVASFDVLGLSQVNAFLQEVVLMYLPRVIVAVLVLLLAVVIADTMQRFVTGAARAAHMKSANFLGSVTRWSIWIFAVLTALAQLNVAVQFINTLFTGVIVALSLGFGLAFGLGGQDAAGRFIDRIKQEIADRHHN
jgi:hypothetical protein